MIKQNRLNVSKNRCLKIAIGTSEPWNYTKETLIKERKKRKKEREKERAANRLFERGGGPSSAGHMAARGGCGEGHQSNKACTI